MKTFLFTHTDLDGVGCAVAATMTYSLIVDAEELQISYVHYGNVNQVLGDFIKKIRDCEECEEPVRVHITDICPEGEEGKEICVELDKLNTEKKIKLFLCDHHDTSSWVKQYPWAWHDVRDEMCGTKLYMDFLRRRGHSFDRVADEFGECVCVYDNWLTGHPLRPRSENINRYLFFVGFDGFVYRFSRDQATDLSSATASVITQLCKNERAYVQRVIDKQCIGDFILEDRDKKKYCIVVAEKNASQICHAALDTFSQLDYAMNLNVSSNKGDLRSRPGGTDVSKIAERLGGGGRAQTAGFMMSLREILKLALKNTI